MNPAVIVTKLSAVSATGCEHVSAATEGDVWENVLRIIGCNAQSVASNHRSKLIGGFDFSQVGQLFLWHGGLFFFFSLLIFFTRKNVLKWVMLHTCWEWNISPQIGVFFLSSSNVSVKGDTRQRGRMAWKCRKHSSMQILQLKCKTHDFHTFSCLGPYILNSLPQDIRHCSILSSSKAKLKTFLFAQYFHPN